MIYVGVDPGLNGAIAAILPDKSIEFHDMPTIGGKKATLDYHGLAHILRRYPARDESIAFIEQVGAMPGQGVSSMFRFGQTFGAALGILAALQIPYQQITPQSWKKQWRLIGKEKDCARGMAIEIFPQAAEHLARKKDVGRADALLIAAYGKSHWLSRHDWPSDEAYKNPSDLTESRAG